MRAGRSRRALCVTMQADAVTSALVTAYTTARAAAAIRDIDPITHNRPRRSRRASERDESSTERRS